MPLDLIVNARLRNYPDMEVQGILITILFYGDKLNEANPCHMHASEYISCFNFEW